MAFDLRRPEGTGKFTGDAQAIAGILQTIQTIQQRNRQTQVLGRLSQALASNQPIDQALAGLDEPQRGGFLNRLLNPNAISGQPTQLEQQLIGGLVQQRIADPSGLGIQQKQATLDLTKARTAAAQRTTGPSPTVQIAQKRLKAINDLEDKLKSGTASAADKAKFETAIGIKAETPQERLKFWTQVLDVSSRPTLNPDGSLNANPLPNVSAEARRQVQIATQDIQGPSRKVQDTSDVDAITGVFPVREPGTLVNRIVKKAPGSPVAPVPGARVQVKDKDGNLGTIPASQLQEALKQGFTRVK